MKSLKDRGYTIEPGNRFFQAMRSIAEYEIRPGNTMSFFAEVDLGEVEIVRAGHPQRPSYTAFVVKAVALALRRFPYANRRVCRRLWVPWALPRLQSFHHCDISVACERDVPQAESVTFIDVIRDAEQLDLAQINARLRTLATCTPENNRQWRDFSGLVGRSPHWLAAQVLRLPYYFPSFWTKYRGAAVMISSPAKYGVDGLIGTWTAPLGISFGLVKQRPVVRQGQIVARPTFLLTLNFDRRVMAGAQAAKFFRAIVDELESGCRNVKNSDQDTAHPQTQPENDTCLTRS